MVKYDLIVSRNDIYKLPNRMGVYVFFSIDQVVLYVGKSKNIRTRVVNHFWGSSYEMAKNVVERIYEVGIVFCADPNVLDEVEGKIISILKPIVNIYKVNYIKDVDIYSLESLGKPNFQLCKHTDHNDKPCTNKSTRENGFCYLHNPDEVKPRRVPSWVVHNKPLTTEMLRLIHEEGRGNRKLTFYMSNVTFGKLISEKTFATIEYINEAIVLKFKRHIVIIDEDETIRL